MRTIIDLPKEQIHHLATLCEEQGISRAEAIRRAVAKMLEENKKFAQWRGIEQFFGMWKDREDIGDSIEYQRHLRSEWDRGWDKR